jgi:hypothetical protein
MRREPSPELQVHTGGPIRYRTRYPATEMRDGKVGNAPVRSRVHQDGCAECVAQQDDSLRSQRQTRTQQSPGEYVDECTTFDVRANRESLQAFSPLCWEGGHHLVEDLIGHRSRQSRKADCHRRRFAVSMSVTSTPSAASPAPANTDTGKRRPQGEIRHRRSRSSIVCAPVDE